jgi:cytochrome c6
MKTTPVIATVALGALLTLNPLLAQEPAKGRSGEAIYKESCASCHPKGGNVIKPKDILKGSKRMKDAKVFLAWLRKPVQPMPPYPASKISDGEAEALYAYIVEQLKGAWK